MPRTLTEYRVFIGSPGGLDEERRRFRSTIDRFNEVHGSPTGVVFAAVGWEDTLGGVGRPQEQINEDLRGCDYAVFVLHDRWGSPTGNGKSSGTEEEWDLALELYAARTIRNISLFFRDVDPARLRDAGPQLTKVLAFKAAIEAERKHLFKAYPRADVFCETLEGHLAKWLRDHGAGRSASLSVGPEAPAIAAAPAALATEAVRTVPAETAAPSLAYWLGEARTLLDATPLNAQGALFCAERAVALATTDLDWAGAENLRGIARHHLSDVSGAVESFDAIAARLAGTTMPGEQERLAIALFNKGVALSALGRSDEAIATYDEVIARFGTATEPALRVQVARALVNKGVALGNLQRMDEEIAAYDELIRRFGSAAEPALRERIADALVNKGLALGDLGRGDEAIAVCDEAIARFGTATEPALRVHVARALLNKGVALCDLGRSDEAVATFEDVTTRFGSAAEPALREQLSKALVNKGTILGNAGHKTEEIVVYEDVIARFGTAAEPALREPVAVALVNKGAALGSDGHNTEAIAVYDEVVGRFSSATEPALCRQLAMALVNKGVALSRLNRIDEAIAAYDEVIARFGSAPEPKIKALVDTAQSWRDALCRKRPEKS